MDAKQKIWDLISEEFVSLGHTAQEIAEINPKDGTWGNALSYEVVLTDETRTLVRRIDIDYNNRVAIHAALQRFA